MLLVIKRIILFVGAQALIFTFASGENRTFTGADVNDQNFSNSLNWLNGDKPAVGDTVLIGANKTATGSPAIINEDLELGGFNVFSNSNGGTGTSYAELSTGKTLRVSAISVGNSINEHYDGDLLVRTGSTIASRYQQSGSLSIGGYGDGSVRVEAGVTFGHTLLNLQERGTLTFEIGNGVGNVSTFESTKTNASAHNTLDGVLQVDFRELNVLPGNYTLIDGSGNTTLDGALKDALDGNGVVTSVNSSNYFEVLNNSYDLDWHLKTADGGKDLQLVVGIIPEPNALSLVVVVAVGVMSMRRPRMSFTDKS